MTIKLGKMVETIIMEHSFSVPDIVEIKMYSSDGCAHSVWKEITSYDVILPGGGLFHIQTSRLVPLSEAEEVTP